MNDFTDADSKNPEPTRPGNTLGWAALTLFLLPWFLFLVSPGVAVQCAILMFAAMTAAAGLMAVHLSRKLIAQHRVRPAPPASHFLAYALGPLLVWATSTQLSGAAAAAGRNSDLPIALRMAFSAVAASWPFVGLAGLWVSIILFWLAINAKRK